MIEIVKANQRHFSDFGWLKTYWLFSFASYFDPRNIQFGALRVFNDDVVAPKGGFPTHPHEEMEIITVVLSGEVTHADSMGHETIIKAGDVQRMSAGTGLTHSEFNLGTVATHFYQIWLLPDQAGLAPSYDQRSFDASAWANRLCPIASGQGLPDTVSVHTDATIYRAQLESGCDLSFEATAGRRLFLYMTRGVLAANGQVLSAQDQARIDIEVPLEIRAEEETDLILIDVPSCKGWGYNEQVLRGEKPS